MSDNRSRRQIRGEVISWNPEHVGNGAHGASNWMTRSGPKSDPSLKVGPSMMAAGEEEMEE